MKRQGMARIFRACSILLLMCPAAARAQRAEPPAASRPAGPTDPAEMESFFDGVMAAQKEAHNTVGATIAVVKDGKLFFAKGYGYANRAARKPVDPARTLFRIGSVSKLFTWTAVMQLVEQGKLKLDADVNTYLTDFKIPPTFESPVTLAHLLTHTPGFEDQVIGLFARRPEEVIPLAQLLAREMPKRVRPPGQLAAYSNHGTALAGYIVERVSGMPWEEYVEKNILQPLEMSHTTVRQPIPAALAADMSAGYKYARGDYEEQGFEYVPAQPAGSISASAVDMAHFMIAHLQLGRYADHRILSEDTARQMHSRLFAHTPQLNGSLHGFYEMNRNGLRIFGHGGDTFWFHSQLMLLPDHNLGLFVSCNSDSAAPGRSQLVRAFLDHYWPVPEAAPAKPPAGSAARAARFTGSYASLRRSYTTVAKLGQLTSSIRISATPEGYLVSSGLGRGRRRWVEAGPLLFREVDGQDTLAFKEDAQGRITHLFISELPPISFARLSPTETPPFHFTVLGLSLLLLLAALIAWPIGAWRRRGQPVAAPRLARLLAWVFCALCVAFALGTALALRDPVEIAFGIPPLLKKVLVLPMVAAVFAAGMALFAVLSWMRGYWNLRGRLFYVLVTLAGLTFLWWLNYWNLFGYHLI